MSKKNPSATSTNDVEIVDAADDAPVTNDLDTDFKQPDQFEDRDEKVEAFVLRDCGFGAAGEVVTLSAEEAKAGEQHGMLDLHPNAVKAAKVK